MNVLGWRIPIPGCNAAFIVLIFFSDSTDAFMTKISLWFPWRFFPDGGLGESWTPSFINNYLPSGLMLLNNVAEMSNGNMTSCRITLILKEEQGIKII